MTNVVLGEPVYIVDIQVEEITSYKYPGHEIRISRDKLGNYLGE